MKLIGERIHLLPLEIGHVESLFKAVDSPEIWTYLPSRMENVKDMRLHVEEALAAREKGIEVPFVVFDQQTNQIVGLTRLLNLSKENRSCEIGWTWYATSVWRTRVNTEAKYLLLRHCFETLSLIRVQFKADSRNVRSNRAIERIGATLEGVLRQDRILYDGYVRDTCYHSILATEWPSVKTRLESFLEAKASV